jgi:hypothetical protein
MTTPEIATSSNEPAPMPIGSSSGSDEPAAVYPLIPIVPDVLLSQIIERADQLHGTEIRENTGNV